MFLSGSMLAQVKRSKLAGEVERGSVVRLTERGIADVFAIAFMFIILILGSAIMHAHGLRPLQAATARQLKLKCEYLHGMLETSWVEPYAIGILKAAAEQIVLESPTVPDQYLRLYVTTVLEHLRPSGYGVVVLLSQNGKAWMLTCPEQAHETDEKFIARGQISIAKAGGEVMTLSVEVRLFKI